MTRATFLLSLATAALTAVLLYNVYQVIAAVQGYCIRLLAIAPIH